jgi:diadenosine tetraphosphate (Ap4A) HIT family hydrolase
MKTKKKECPFCPKKGRLAHLTDFVKFDDCEKSLDCERSIYDDGHCLAVLAPEQYTSGHTLVILKEHKEGMTADMSGADLPSFITTINEVAQHLKKEVRNERDKEPENVYACILSDGIKHLHAVPQQGTG